jgi:hypothetical protein
VLFTGTVTQARKTRVTAKPLMIEKQTEKDLIRTPLSQQVCFMAFGWIR